ncbi:MAG: hypothetical protein HUJ24_07845 [Rhodobacteraceae bacterium]|nr:hypothetical protein [Paracoccaceae bacterium]
MKKNSRPLQVNRVSPCAMRAPVHAAPRLGMTGATAGGKSNGAVAGDILRHDPDVVELACLDAGHDPATKIQ